MKKTRSLLTSSFELRTSSFERTTMNESTLSKIPIFAIAWVACVATIMAIATRKRFEVRGKNEEGSIASYFFTRTSNFELHLLKERP
jgi:hypothetical protein